MLDATNDAIYRELIELNRKAEVTGRKSYKRLSELQTKMLQDFIATTKKSEAQFNQILETNGSLIETCNRLVENKAKLEQENNFLFWTLQGMKPDAKECNA